MISNDIERDTQISQDTLCDIANLVLHCAKIDHAVSLVLFQSIGIKENSGFVLIGQTSISQKMKTLSHFINEFYDDETRAEFVEISKNISLVNTCRNYIAHGLYAGTLKATREYCFILTSQFFLPEDEFTTFKIAAYTSKLIKSFSKIAEHTHKLICLKFSLEPWHDKERGQILPQRPPRQKPGQRKTASPHSERPQSSQE